MSQRNSASDASGSTRVDEYGPGAVKRSMQLLVAAFGNARSAAISYATTGRAIRGDHRCNSRLGPGGEPAASHPTPARGTGRQLHRDVTTNRAHAHRAADTANPISSMNPVCDSRTA